MKSLDLHSVLDDIRSVISNSTELIKKTGVFGSLARGTYHEESDIDILIEYNMTPDFKMDRFTQFCGLCNQISETLSELYERKVDIVHFEGSPDNSLQDENINREVIWL